jgi:hypothetical protein
MQPQRALQKEVCRRSMGANQKKICVFSSDLAGKQEAVTFFFFASRTTTVCWFFHLPSHQLS